MSKTFSDMQNNVIKMLELIRSDYPHLSMKMDLEPQEPVDLLFDIPAQNGLKFDVKIYLSDDELHLTIGKFWCEWFPCTDPRKIEEFNQIVRAIINGTSRIVDIYRGNKCLKSEIQRLEDNHWKAVAVSIHTTLLVPWWKPIQMIVLQNTTD